MKSPPLAVFPEWLTDEIKAQLGKRSDASIAMSLGIATCSVSIQRNTYQIFKAS